MTSNPIKLNLFQSKAAENKVHVEKVTKWVNDEMMKMNDGKRVDNHDPQAQVEEDFIVMVTEIQCSEPDCVPIETMVIIIGSNGQKYSNKIMKPVAEVIIDDVEALLMSWELYRMSSQRDHPSLVEYIPEVVDVKALIASHISSFVASSDKQKQLDYLKAISDFIQQELNNAATADDMPELLVDGEVTTFSHAESTMVPMMSKSSSSSSATNAIAMQGSKPLIVVQSRGIPPSRHEKGARGPRGCPCCDPDNIENIADRMLFLDTPP